MRRIQRLGRLVLFVAFSILVALAIANFTGLSLKISAVIAAAAGLLVYLMLDSRPEPDPGDQTIIRLTKGSWARKKR